VRWWRLAAGGAILLWVLGTAYRQAHRRGRELGAAVVLVGVAVFMFAVGALAPRPPLSADAAAVLVVGSVVLLGVAMAIVLWRGFRE
jgi:membrane protein YdbS with pleckstrin-like domain